MGGCGNAASSPLLNKGQWQAGLNYRYFRSFRHFRGDHQEENRVEMGTEVVNVAHAIDFGLTRGLTKRITATLSLPILFYDRSSLYEHYGNSLSANPDQLRFHTQAKGIGDLRLSAARWLFDPEHHTRRNISLGLGIKLPTGNANVEDDFHKRLPDGTDTVTVRPVDQSIQPGDGGVGAFLEIQGFSSINHRTALYFNGFYLSNPRNTNNTLTRGTLTGADPLIAYHSVADQFMIRIGMNYSLWPAQNLSANLGVRAEGIPAKDLIGKSDGFRRPGFVVAAEPGLFYQKGRTGIALSVPLALYRNRIKSTYDLSDPSGQRHGDAAFADYSLNLGLTWRFGGQHNAQTTPAKPLWEEVKQ